MDSGRESKDTATLTRLKQTLEMTELTNKEKIQIYGHIRRLRNASGLNPGEYDALGFNLLHWATECNQIEEVNELISKFEWSDGDKKQGADMDAPTSQPWNFVRNMTPLWIAAKQGYVSIACLLLKNQADLFIAPEEYVSSFFGGAWYEKSTPLVEASNHHHKEIVKLLEQPTLEAYIKRRKENHSEYKTTTSVFGLFNKQWGYSKTDKLKAAHALQEQLNAKECTQESLVALEKIHPAVNDGELGSIYQASLGIRKRF